MARKKKHEGHANHERWLVSYADFITLLFAFFVVMFASSQTDKAKAVAISESVTDALSKGGVQAVVHEVLGGTVDEKGKGNAQLKGPGGSEPRADKLPPPPPPSKLIELLPSLQHLNEALKDEIKSGKLEVKQEERGLVISLSDAAFFPSGDDTLDPKSIPIVEKIVKLYGKDPNPIRLEGHTDSRPIHSPRFGSNWELSTARGVAMLELLEKKFGIPHDRLAVTGYADTMPKASNDTEEGRQKNRRVDIVILAQPVMTPQQEQLAAAAAKAAGPAAPAAPAAQPAKPSPTAPSPQAEAPKKK